jgi:hypothetical protein
MDAIFKYCQKMVRYEQVYFEYGGIIPNSSSQILKNGFGDCKDYSALIYSMAKAIGLNANLALCFRGRGIDDLHDIPVQQFNHMIACLNYKNELFWYDGTNRDGLPSVTTSDLINQKALLLEKGASRIELIREHGSNLLSVAGTLKAEKTDLKGNLLISLGGQFAVDFRYFSFVLNKQELSELISDWVRTSLNKDMVVDSIATTADRETYRITFKCRIPNSLLEIDSQIYSGVKSVFPELISPLPEKYKLDEIFYNPSFNKCTISLKMENLFKSTADANTPFMLEWNHELPAGSFNSEEAKSFVEKLKTVFTRYISKQKLIKKGVK